MGAAGAQPALTTIQDILYRADGTRFSGTLYIRYSSFQAGDLSNIATANLTVPIVNGSLRVQLVPTTTASAGAQYNVTYNSRGMNQFVEVWAVPPSALPLRVRDVRVGTGTVIGPPPVVTPVQIQDVVGLSNELSIRPQRGVGFGIGRVAVINQAGQIDAASGNPGDCVRVDGSAGTCGTSGGGIVPGFRDGEIPGGAVNGANTVFTLALAPSPAASLELYRNGLLMKQTVDYNLSGSTITFLIPSMPQTGDQLLANYRFGNPSDPLSSLTVPQVVCSSTGNSTSATTLTQLASCTVPAGLLTVGDRLEVRFQYGHVGTSTGFTGEVRIGGAAVASRLASATESLLVGNTSFGLSTAGQTWNTQSWGTSLALAATAGSAVENISQALTVSFQGQMAAASSDSVELRNFTVVRYPAQVNP